MPNWCSTSYVLSSSKENIDKLHGVMSELQSMDKPFSENGFGPNWLGCLVDRLGGNHEEVWCRGS